MIKKQESNEVASILFNVTPQGYGELKMVGGGPDICAIIVDLCKFFPTFDGL